MAIRCLFLTPDEQCPCQVLRALGAPALQQQTQAQLQARYCSSGAFIACPVFTRVEQGLSEANRLRSAAVDLTTVPNEQATDLAS
jgi:hypothetical protein